MSSFGVGDIGNSVNEKDIESEPIIYTSSEDESVKNEKEAYEMEDISTSSKNMKNGHIKASKKYQCKVCNKIYNKSQSLWAHKRSHLGELTTISFAISNVIFISEDVERDGRTNVTNVESGSLSRTLLARINFRIWVIFNFHKYLHLFS